MRRPMAAAASKMRSVHMSRTEMTHSAAAPAMAATAAPATAATVTATTAAVATAPVTGERAAGRAQSNYDCAVLTANLSAARFLSSNAWHLNAWHFLPPTWHFPKRTANARLAEPFRRLRDWDAALHDRGDSGGLLTGRFSTGRSFHLTD